VLSVARDQGPMLQDFYPGNLPPFHGNTVIMCYKAILPCKLEWAVNYQSILTLEKVRLKLLP
jgi:hypothetical protein